MEWDEVEEEARRNWNPAKMGLWKRYKVREQHAPHHALCGPCAKECRRCAEQCRKMVLAAA